ncbi:MAG TPA: anti-sigma factor antagonist [Firmicutes bacterium]|nr:anti-sigma factor antagonist [Bacillota bacterium]
MNVKLETHRYGRSLVVRLGGELDLKTAGEFRDAVDRELERHEQIRNIVLIFDEVTFIDSSGLGAILGRYKRASQMGGKLVAAGLTPQIKKIFELSGLLKIIPVCDSETRALELV